MEIETKNEKKENKKELTPREMRIALAEANKKEETSEAVNVKEEFRIFFARKKEKLSLDKDLEKIIWMHIRSSGHCSPEFFEAGFNHFYGIK